MPATNTRSAAGRRSQTSGAVKAPNDCADHDEPGAARRSRRRRCRIGREARRLIVGRKVRRHDVMAARSELRGHQVPVPAAVAGAVDQDERRHRQASLRRCDDQAMACVESVEIEQGSVPRTPPPALEIARQPRQPARHHPIIHGGEARHPRTDARMPGTPRAASQKAGVNPSVQSPGVRTERMRPPPRECGVSSGGGNRRRSGSGDLREVSRRATCEPTRRYLP